MSDLWDALERKRHEIPPEAGAFERLLRARRSRQRRRTTAAIVAVAALVAPIGWAVVSLDALRGEDLPAEGSMPVIERIFRPGLGAMAGIAVLDGDAWVGSSSIPGVVRLNGLTGAVDDSVRVHRFPEVDVQTHQLISDVVAAFGSIWVIENEEGTLTRVDPTTGHLTATVRVDPFPTRVAAGAGALWVINSSGTVNRIDPSTDRVVATVPLPADMTGVAIAGDDAGIWVCGEGGWIVRIDPGTNGLGVRVKMQEAPTAVAVGDDAVWVAQRFEHAVFQLDPQSGAVIARYDVGWSPSSIVVAAGRAWVASVDGTLASIDPTSGDVSTPTRISSRVDSMTHDEGLVWTLDAAERSLTRVRLSG